MAKNLEISLLLDFYGDMLTEKQRDVVELYYNEDLSLSEIAAHSGITRQGVRDSIKRAESVLLDLEERLGLARKFRQIQDGWIRSYATRNRLATTAAAMGSQKRSVSGARRSSGLRTVSTSRTG